MCRCTPEIRTPFCGRGDCLPPASREPTESLFGANADGDHLAQFKADQLDAWERRLAQFSNRSDSTGYVGRVGVEVLTELRLARKQAEALADAAALALFYARGSTAKHVRNQLASAEAVLRAYQEGRDE